MLYEWYGIAASIRASALSLSSFCFVSRFNHTCFEGGAYLDDSLFPCPQLQKGVSIRANKYESDIFEHEADVCVNKSGSVEFGQADGQPCLGCT